MFTQKREATKLALAAANGFLAAGNGFIKQSRKSAAKTTSLGNGAVKYTTTGNEFVDDFGKATNFKAPRSYAEISKTMSTLWAENPELCIKELFYLRMITRQVVLPNGEKTESTQRGQGLRHEGIFRMIWLAVNHEDAFWKNLDLFISIGSWKDVITMLQYDLVYNGWNGRVLDWDTLGLVLLAGLENDATTNLVKKYLPQVKAKSACKTVEAQADNSIAKWICSLLYGTKDGDQSGATYKSYRKLKTTGNAHEWQKLISKGQFLKIDFDTVHGRALAQLVSGKFLKNKGLETKYQSWIASKPVAKFTGYPYELFSTVPHEQYKIDTVNKQFLGLIDVAKKGMSEDQSTFIVVVDSSASMDSTISGAKMSAYHIAKSMALYFSYLLKGVFENHYLEFSDSTIMKTWKGSTPVEKFRNDNSRITASTNFLSVADHFAKIKRQGVPESDFPTGILCISDGCFNSAGSQRTNVVALKQKLSAAGFSKKYVDDFKVVLWDTPNGYYGGKSQTAFEDFADCPNLFHMSGLDPAAVAFITGLKKNEGKLPTTSEELFLAAMDQEVLNLITV